MKTKIAFILVALLHPWLAVAQTPPTSGMQLYLLIGQSNMAGRGPIGDMTNPTELPLAPNPTHIWMLNSSNQWVRAQNPIHYRYGDAYGLASSFASVLAAADPNVDIGLIPCAYGGASLGEWTQNASPSTRYDEAISRTQVALQSGELVGILWHQGEANIHYYSTYVEVFAEMIGDLRHDLGAQNVPVIAGELGRFVPNKQNINIELNKLTSFVPRCQTASSWNLTDDALNGKNDNLHFDTPSLETLGERYVDKLTEVESWLNIEAEDLTWTMSGGISMAAGPVDYTASNEHWMVHKATAANQYVEATVASIPAGTYSVRVRYRRYSQRGQFQLSIDSLNQGSVVEEYSSANSDFFQTTLGVKTFSTGNHTFRFTCAGKNTNSSYYYISIDSIVLVPQ